MTPQVTPQVTPQPLVARWLKFSAVGVLGIGVQMACFALLFSGLRVNYLAATALAVEAAVLHNFGWHERYTWKDRRIGGMRGRFYRLARFHAANGVVSVLGNLALMRLFVGTFGINHYVSSGIAIGACSLVNFAASEWFVFTRANNPDS